MKEYKEHRDKFFQKGNVKVGSIRLIGSGDIHLKDIHDKVDCLQRSQVYLHNHIGKIENDIEELKGLILRRLTGTGVKPCGVAVDACGPLY